MHRSLGPLIALAGGLLLLAVGAGLIAAHVTVFALDETLIEQSAVHYTSGLPHTLFHDLDARATNRLYPLLLSIPLRLFDGAQALRIDHMFNVLLFLSAAVPIFLLARVLLRSSWLAVATALLSVAVPWLTLTSALFTENLSYPLFWWMILATAAAIWRGGLGRDALALLTIALLVGTRVQFAAVFVGYVLAMLLRSFQLTAARDLRFLPRLGAALRSIARSYPLSLLLLACMLVVALHEKLSGRWEAHVQALLGGYSNVIIRNGLPANMGQGLLIELIALALGVGLLPAIVSIAWFFRRMAQPQLDRRWVYVAVSAIVILAFLVLTVYAQGGYLGTLTEERYFFYVVPVFWLGTFAAVEERNLRPMDLLLVAGGLALVYASIPFLSPLGQETAFLDPAESVVPHVFSSRFADIGLTGLSMQDALALLAVIVGGLAAWLWRGKPARRVWWTVAAAVAAQLLLTGYAFAVIDGKVSGIAGRTAGSVSALGWVDAHAGGARVAWLDNLSTAAPPTTFASPVADQMRTTLFWNSRVRNWIHLPELGLPSVEVPMAALPGYDGVSVNQSTGVLSPPLAASRLTTVVGARNSPFLQLEGVTLARSREGVLALTRLAHPARATWVARGLRQDGGILIGGPVHIAAFGVSLFTARAGTPRQALTIVLSVVPAPPVAGATAQSGAPLAIRFGHASAHIDLTPGMPQRIRLTTCLAAGSAVATGTVTALSPPSSVSTPGALAAKLQEVSIMRGSCTHVRQNRRSGR